MKLEDVKRQDQDLTELDQDLETEMVHSRKKNETPILQAMKNIRYFFMIENPFIVTLYQINNFFELRFFHFFIAIPIICRMLASFSISFSFLNIAFFQLRS